MPMAARWSALILAAAVLAIGPAARGQGVPLAVTSSQIFRMLTGPNLLDQYDEGDVLRIEVFVTRSTVPTTVTATNGDRRIELAFYSGPMLDDLYQAVIPFDPAL